MNQYQNQNQNMNAVFAQAAALPQETTNRCSGIINLAAAACGLIGAGMAQIPGSDSVAMVPIQIKMVRDLGRVFNIEIGESSIESFVVSAAATAGGRALSQLLLRYFPGVGNVVNGLTAAGVTELVGWIAVMNFSQRGSLL